MKCWQPFVFSFTDLFFHSNKHLMTDPLILKGHLCNECEQWLIGLSMKTNGMCECVEKKEFNLKLVIYCPIITYSIALFHKSHNATHNVHISVTNWCIVGYLSNALWDLWDRSCNMILHADQQLQHKKWLMQYKSIFLEFLYWEEGILITKWFPYLWSHTTNAPLYHTLTCIHCVIMGLHCIGK